MKVFIQINTFILLPFILKSNAHGNLTMVPWDLSIKSRQDIFFLEIVLCFAGSSDSSRINDGRPPAELCDYIFF